MKNCLIILFSLLFSLSGFGQEPKTYFNVDLIKKNNIKTATQSKCMTIGKPEVEKCFTYRITSFNNNGEIEKSINYNEKDSIIGYRFYRYNENHQITCDSLTYPDGSFFYCVVTKYLKTGEVTRSDFHSKYGTKIRNYEYSNDSVYLYDIDESDNSRKLKNVYFNEKKKNLIFTITNGKRILQYESVNDENGRLIDEISYDETTGSIKTHFKYFYDDKGLLDYTEDVLHAGVKSKFKYFNK